MWCLSKKLNDDYAVELTLFHKLRDFKDGVTFFDFHANVDLYKGDHNPKFDLHLILFNFTVFEFNIYNLHHVNDED